MKKTLIYTFIWIAAIYLLAIFLPQVIHTGYSFEQDWLHPYWVRNFYHLLNFDGSHYQRIAQNSYDHIFITVFFPLCPLLIKGVSLASFNLLSLSQSALFISLVCFIASTCLLYRLTKSNKVVLSLLLFPLSFFFLAGYTESLFLFLSLLAYLLFKKDRKSVV